MKRVIFVLLSLFIAQQAWALSVPDKPHGYVNDYAGLLSDPVRSRLEETLRSFDVQTSNQLTVAIFKSLEGESLEDFSIHLAEKWKPGTAKHDNGVILLIFAEDHKVRIEVGYGLEGALPDAIASRIIQEKITPAFRAQDFDRGVSDAVEAIIAATKGEYKPSPTANTDDWVQKHAGVLLMLLIFYLVFPLACYALALVLMWQLLAFPAGILSGIIIVVFLAALRAALSKSLLGQTISSRPGRGGFWGGGFYGGGSGGGFSGGGFSGGGGSFGGGGASGGW